MSVKGKGQLMTYYLIGKEGGDGKVSVSADTNERNSEPLLGIETEANSEHLETSPDNVAPVMGEEPS